MQAFNVRKVLDHTGRSKRTIELRGFSPPKSADDIVRRLELIEARLNLLRNLRGLIDVTLPRSNGRSIDSEAAMRFRQYVEEANLEWSRYEDLVPTAYRDIAFKNVIPGRVQEARYAAVPPPGMRERVLGCLAQSLRRLVPSALVPAN